MFKDIQEINTIIKNLELMKAEVEWEYPIDHAATLDAVIDSLKLKLGIKRQHADDYYFRVCRNGKWDNIYFSDLTRQEMEEVLKNKDTTWLRSLCIGLGEQLSNI